VTRLRHASGLDILVWTVFGAGSALAQAQAQPPAGPPAEPPIWTGSFGAGLALTSGNADTTNFNLAAKLTHDPRNPHLVTADAFYLHGTSEGDTIVSRPPPVASLTSCWICRRPSSPSTPAAAWCGRATPTWTEPRAAP